MRKFILLFIAAVILFSCNKKSPSQKLLVPREEIPIAGFYIKPDGSPEVGVLLQVIQRKDSAGQILSDTIFGRRIVSSVMDSVSKKPVLDSLGFNKISVSWVLIGRDAFYLPKPGQNLDSLFQSRWGQKNAAIPKK